MNLIGFGLLVLAFSQSVRSDGLFRIAVSRTKSLMEGLLEQNTHPQYLDKIFGYRKFNTFRERNDLVLATTPKPEPRENTTVKIYKYLESQFCGEILLGSPGQMFQMVLDTSSVHSWVPSVLCSPFEYPACYVKRRYDSTKSSTYLPTNQNYTIYTEKGNLFGFVGLDKLHLGQINVHNQSFVEVENLGVKYLTNYGCDGILGMGLDDNPNDIVTPFIYNMIYQKVIKVPVFSLYFNRDKTTPSGGSLFVGGSEKKHYFEPFTYLSVESKYSWIFHLDKIKLSYVLPYINRSVEICSSGCKAFPESGDLLIRGPRNDIKTINRFLSANFVPYLNRYEVPCSKISKLPSVSFYLAGKNFTLRGKDYVQELTYGPVQLCLSAFAELPGPPQEVPLWGLGVSFLAQFYTEFDLMKNKIGIAKAKSNW